jgi:hypothetical protein
MGELSLEEKKQGGQNLKDDSGPLGNRLHGLFGGVPGYTAEFILGLKNDQTLVDFALDLSGRVLTAMTDAAGGVHNLEKLANAWLNQINDPDNDDWGFATRDCAAPGASRGDPPHAAQTFDHLRPERLRLLGAGENPSK